jgi:signal transduction histidine kinase
VTRADLDQTFTLKLKTMHYKNEESVLIFLQDITFLQ